MTPTLTLEEQVRACKDASRTLARMSTAQKNRALLGMADALLTNEEPILAANAIDITNAEKNGLSAAMVDRLVLNRARLEKMAQALRDVASFEDPVGQRTATWTRPNGIEVGYMRIPLGVIAMIYE